jgi:hypothetical protein
MLRGLAGNREALSPAPGTRRRARRPGALRSAKRSPCWGRREPVRRNADAMACRAPATGSRFANLQQRVQRLSRTRTASARGVGRLIGRRHRRRDASGRDLGWHRAADASVLHRCIGNCAVQRPTGWRSPSAWAAIRPEQVDPLGTPAVLRSTDGRIEVFVRDRDDRLKHGWQGCHPGGAFSRWDTKGSFLSPAGGPDTTLQRRPTATADSNRSHARWRRPPAER